MKKLTMKNYTGGAGPSTEQTKHNTMVLAQELKRLGIKFEGDYTWAEEMWGGDEVLLRISKKGFYIMVGYDRWGFVIDGIGMDADQTSLKQTIKDIKDFLKTPSLSSLTTKGKKVLRIGPGGFVN